MIDFDLIENSHQITIQKKPVPQFFTGIFLLAIFGFVLWLVFQNSATFFDVNKWNVLGNPAPQTKKLLLYLMLIACSLATLAGIYAGFVCIKRAIFGDNFSFELHRKVLIRNGTVISTFNEIDWIQITTNYDRDRFDWEIVKTNGKCIRVLSSFKSKLSAYRNLANKISEKTQIKFKDLT